MEAETEDDDRVVVGVVVVVVVGVTVDGVVAASVAASSSSCAGDSSATEGGGEGEAIAGTWLGSADCRVGGAVTTLIGVGAGCSSIAKFTIND